VHQLLAVRRKARRVAVFCKERRLPPPVGSASPFDEDEPVHTARQLVQPHFQQLDLWALKQHHVKHPWPARRQHGSWLHPRLRREPMPPTGASDARYVCAGHIDASSVAHHARGRAGLATSVDVLAPTGIAAALLLGHAVASVLPHDEHCTRSSRQRGVSASGCPAQKHARRARGRTHHEEEQVASATSTRLLAKRVAMVGGEHGLFRPPDTLEAHCREALCTVLWQLPVSCASPRLISRTATP
jgi:hypothetical protein